MAYEPTTWKSGDVVTAAKLNKLEKGVEDASGGGVLVVTVTGSDDNYTSDTTFSQIKTAITNGSFVILRYSAESGVYSDYQLFETYFSDTPEEEIVKFFRTGVSNAVDIEYFSISYDDSITYETVIYPSEQ